MIQNVAQFTTVMQTNGAGQYQYLGQWGGLTRIRSGWHATPGAAWTAYSLALAPHLARSTARALPTG